MQYTWTREGCKRFLQRGMASQYDPYRGSKIEMQRSYNDSLSSKANSSQWEKQQTEKTSHLEKVPFSEGQSQSQADHSHWQQEQGRYFISPIFQHLNCSGGWVSQPPLAPSRSNRRRVIPWALLFLKGQKQLSVLPEYLHYLGFPFFSGAAALLVLTTGLVSIPLHHFSKWGSSGMWHHLVFSFGTCVYSHVWQFREGNSLENLLNTAGFQSSSFL